MPVLLAALLLIAAPEDPPAPPAAEKKVCRSQAELGSRIPKRLCYTRAQWDAMERASREETNRSQRYRSSSTPG